MHCTVLSLVSDLWLGGVVVRSQTSECRGSVPIGPLSSNNLEQVIYTCTAHANSAFYPSRVVKWVAVYLVILATKNSCCRRTLWVEVHSVTGWGLCGSVTLQTVGPAFIRSGSRQPIIVLVSTPLQIVNCCCSGFPVNGSIDLWPFDLSRSTRPSIRPTREGKSCTGLSGWG